MSDEAFFCVCALLIQSEFVELFYVVLHLDALKPFCKETDLLLDKKPLSRFALHSPPREQLLLFSRPLQLDIIRGHKDWEEHIDMTSPGGWGGGTVEITDFSPRPTVPTWPVCCSLC